MEWLLAIFYLGQIIAMMKLARSQFPGRPVRTMLIVENPATPLELEKAQELLAPTGAIVIPALRL